MALVISTEYTHAQPPDADYPQGSFKNVSTPAGIDGTPLEKAWPNDLYGFFQRLLDETSKTPSGVPDTILASDYFDALESIISRNFLFRGAIDGLITSNNIVDSDHDIDIAAGQCRDSGNAKSIFLDSAITKQVDVNWAEGTNLGGFPSGLTLAADTWYHMFVIMSADGSKIDAGFDTNLAAVNLLADATAYSVYRRIGSVLTDGSANINGFVQIGDEFTWKTPIDDFSGLTGIVEVTQAVRAPLGISTLVFAAIRVDNSVWLRIDHPDVTDTAPTNATPWALRILVNAANHTRVLTNENSQINYRSSGNITLNWATKSYIDLRGKDV